MAKSTCSVDGCDTQEIRGNGYCQLHWRRWKKTGSTRDPSDRILKCIYCGREFMTTAGYGSLCSARCSDRYFRRARGVQPRVRVERDLLGKYCLECGEYKMDDQYAVARTAPDGLHQKCKDCRRIHARSAKYGLTKAEVLELHEKTACEICGAEIHFTTMHVDHCHASGRVRGVLCVTCNVGLGSFKDSPETLLAAAHYLLRDTDVLHGMEESA